jgi:hypothetical protein
LYCLNSRAAQPRTAMRAVPTFSNWKSTPGDIRLGTGRVRLTAGESAGPARGTSSRRPHGTAQAQPRKGALESARTARIPPAECGRNRESVAPQTWQGHARRALRVYHTQSTVHGAQQEDASRPNGPEQRRQHGRHAVVRCCRTARNVQRHTLIATCNAQQTPLSKPLSERIPGGLCYTCRLALAGALMASTREMHQTRSKPPCACVSATNERSRSPAVLERH